MYNPAIIRIKKVMSPLIETDQFKSALVHGQEHQPTREIPPDVINWLNGIHHLDIITAEHLEEAPNAALALLRSASRRSLHKGILSTDLSWAVIGLGILAFILMFR